MPSKSEKQAHFMAAVANGYQPPGRHVDVAVAKEFHNADMKKGVFEHRHLKDHADRNTPSGSLANQSTDAQNSY